MVKVFLYLIFKVLLFTVLLLAAILFIDDLCLLLEIDEESMFLLEKILVVLISVILAKVIMDKL